MARYNGLIIPRSYNDYFSRSDPQAIRDLVSLSADEELNAESKNPLQNQAIAKIVPNTASESNELADKNFVNSTVGTNTANYIYKTESGGEKVPFSSVAELEAYVGTVTNNDYAFVTGIDENGNTYYDRYKADVNDGVVTWAKEYRLNNSSFTAEQWAAIQSGITAEKVAQFEGAVAPVDVVQSGNMSALTSNSVYEALTNYINKTDAATLQQALQLPGVLSGAVAAGDNKAVKSSAVNAILQFFTQNQPQADFSDCNNAPLGFACSNNLANAPLNTSNYVYLLTLRVNNDGNYLEQLAFIATSIDTYRRIKVGGNWTSWYKIALSNELINKSYGEDIDHSNGQYAKLTINVTVTYSTSIIALMGRGASLALIGICANDSGDANVRTYLKDKGSYTNGAFFYKPISRNSIELYWCVGAYSTFSNYQIIANTKNTEVTADIVNSLPGGAIQL